jgi:hypothetical protein
MSACDGCCSTVINGVPGGLPDGIDALWEFDWTAQGDEDFQALGAGTHEVSFGGETITFVNMQNATTYENVAGTGLVAQAASGASRTWTGTPPAAPHHRFGMGGVLPNWQIYKDCTRYWAWWWDLAEWTLPETANAVGWACENAGSDYAPNLFYRPALRQGPYSTGTPTSQFGVQAAESAGIVDTRFPLVDQSWTTLGIVCWGRKRAVSAVAGPASAYGDPARCFEIGNIGVIGNAVTGMASWVNPWGGRFVWGLATQSSVGAPSAILRRQAITRGPLH